jgi:antitoxin component HigA of HigAB toxin-antitoxin module
MIIAVPEKYALQVGSPTPITSERQHAQYLSVLEKLADKDDPTTEEEKYAEVLMTLIAAYEEEHHSIPDASPVEVLRALMDANDLRQKDERRSVWAGGLGRKQVRKAVTIHARPLGYYAVCSLQFH